MEEDNKLMLQTLMDLNFTCQLKSLNANAFTFYLALVRCKLAFGTTFTA